jgi:hypothetical protein
MVETEEPWDKEMPADLVPAVKAIRKVLADWHWKCGRVTEKLCYSLLHPEIQLDTTEYILPLRQLKGVVGFAATARFNQLVKQQVPPATFKAFYDLFVEGSATQLSAAFAHLLEIGRVHEQRLGGNHLHWAKSQLMHIVHHHRIAVRIWVRNVCDVRPYDPYDQTDENIFWRRWQAPLFLIMKPSKYQPYDPAMVWDRKDIDSSTRLLTHFEEDYILRQRIEVDRLIDYAAVQLAKQPTSARTNNIIATVADQPVPASQPAAASKGRQEAGKKKTQAMRRRWNTEYRRLKKLHPDWSDVSCARMIATLQVADGRSPETVRRHMK